MSFYMYFCKTVHSVNHHCIFEIHHLFQDCDDGNELFSIQFSSQIWSNISVIIFIERVFFALLSLLIDANRLHSSEHVGCCQASVRLFDEETKPGALQTHHETLHENVLAAQGGTPLRRVSFFQLFTSV